MKRSTINTFTASRSWLILATLAAWLLSLQPALAQSSTDDSFPQSARLIGTDPAEYIRREVVGSADTADFYQFTLTSKRSVQISLTDLTGDADLFLMGDGGVWVASNRRGRGVAESIRRDLGAGTYRIMVYAWTGTVNHKLTLKTWNPAPTNGISRTLPALDGMNGVSQSVIATGTIAPTQAYIDYYFTLPGRRLVSIQGNGNVAAGVTPDTTPVNWSILKNNQVRDLRLNAGRHYLRVFRNPTSTQSFSFTINARPRDTRDTAGHNQSTARNLGRVGNPPVEIKEYVGQDDFDDYYRVNVSRNAQLNVALTVTQGDGVNMRVLDPLGQVVPLSPNQGGSTFNVSANSLNGGIYYVHVGTSPRGGNSQKDGRYTLRVGTISAPRPSLPPRQVVGPSPDASNDPRRPTFFSDVRVVPGNGGGSLTDGETVGGAADPLDVFTFTVGCNFSSQVPVFTVNTGQTAANVQMYQDVDGRPVPRSFAGPIRPGNQFKNTYDYSLEVTGPPSGANVSYSITVNHLRCE